MSHEIERAKLRQEINTLRAENEGLKKQLAEQETEVAAARAVTARVVLDCAGGRALIMPGGLQDARANLDLGFGKGAEKLTPEERLRFLGAPPEVLQGICVVQVYRKVKLGKPMDGAEPTPVPEPGGALIQLASR